MKKTVVYLILIAWCMTLFSGCGKDVGRVRKDKPAVIPVKVKVVNLENIERVLEYVGNIKGIDEAVVYPKVSGKIIEEVKSEGAEVNKGDAIAYIDRDEVGFKYEKAPIESPLKGIVGRTYIDTGSYVTPQTPVALVTNMEKVKLDLNVPEQYMPYLAIGQIANINVDAYPDDIFNGVVTKISPIVDIETRSAPLEIIIDDSQHRLKSGMFARVKLAIEEFKNTPVVLKEAIMGKGADTYVYVVEGDNAIIKDVKLGVRRGPYFQVKEGLKDGDVVVIMGQQRLKNGAKVSVEREED